MHSIAPMCHVLGVSPGGYYARLKRPPSARAQADGELSARIAAIHRRSHATYGVPRVHAELKAQGLHVGHKRVARLMSTAGLHGASRRRWVTTTVRDRAAKPAPDLIERNFTVAAPNRLWVADISYIPTWAGFLYLAVVLDAFSRKIVGWAMESHLRTELVLAALNMALGQRRPAEVIHHSDHGSQYTALPSAKAVKRPGCGRRWARWETVSTTPCARVSLPPSSASCLTAAASKPRSKHAWRSSSLSKDGITRIAVTRLSTTSHQSITNEPTALNSTFRAATNSRLKNPRRRRTRRREK